MAAADEGTLGALHTKVAEVLIDALDGQTLPEITDEDGTVIQEETKMPVSAAHITAAIQFLKNNNITCAPSQDNALGELERKMKERQEKRAKRRDGNVVDFDAAREQANYLSDRLAGEA